MIQRCPNCGIELKKPPFNGRNTNEVIIVLIYRKFKDNNQKIRDISEIGKCEICDATLDDLEEQKKQNN